jgi:hypothetical protein
MHRKVVVVIGLGLFFEVYETFLSSTIATALKTQRGLGARALELLLASSFLGMFIGAAVFGRLADRIGLTCHNAMSAPTHHRRALSSGGSPVGALHELAPDEYRQAVPVLRCLPQASTVDEIPSLTSSLVSATG